MTRATRKKPVAIVTARAEIELVSDIPLLPLRGGSRPGRKAMYPFERMNVGDSFLVEVEAGGSNSSASISYWQRKLPGRRFTRRRVEGGYRIWRTV